jgi:hypothetical protein
MQAISTQHHEATAFANERWVLAARPQGMVKHSHFRLERAPVPELLTGEFLVKTHYVSLDPAMRGWMNEGTTYIRGVGLGEPMRAFAAGEVVRSRHPLFPVGAFVTGLLGVQRYAVSSGKGVELVDVARAPLQTWLGALGMPGMTAYFGLRERGQPKSGETVLVSAAAGVVGSLVGQIANILGCRTVGIAGGAEKCAMLVHDFGFDVALDYKAGNLAEQLRHACPNGVDVYFDNVGGEMLDTALTNLARGARVVICGAISQYNAEVPQGPKNYLKIVTARGVMNGIIVFDYEDRYDEAKRDIAEWLREGRINTRDHIITGFERFPEALLMLFSGENVGKLLLDTQPLLL